MDSATTTHTDVLVAGGGPAGLLAASLLGKRFHVLVAEQGVVGRTDKYWVTTSQRLALHGLADCTRLVAGRATFGTFLGEPAAVAGSLAVTSEEDVLARLVARCSLASVGIHENCPVEAIRWIEGGILASTPRGDIRCRLLIDATGGRSPIAATFCLHKLHGFFTVYGERVDGITFYASDIAGGHVLRLGHPPLILEIIPVSDSSAYCCLFTITKRAQRYEVLGAALDEQVRRNPFFSWTKSSRYARLSKFGVIPIGRLRHRHFPRVTSFGEAGLMQSPLFGGAFNEALVHANHFAQRVADTLDAGREGSPRKRFGYSLEKKMNDSIQSSLVKGLIDGTTGHLQKLVDLMRRLGESSSCRLLLGELSIGEVLALGLKAVLSERSSKTNEAP